MGNAASWTARLWRPPMLPRMLRPLLQHQTELRPHPLPLKPSYPRCRSLLVREPLRVVFPRPVATSRCACPVVRTLTAFAAGPREYLSCYPLSPNLRRSGGGVNVIQAQGVTWVIGRGCLGEKTEEPRQPGEAFKFLVVRGLAFKLPVRAANHSIQ